MGSTKIIISLFVGLVWFISGLIINTTQAILWCTLRPLNRSLYRRINTYLTYSSWSQIVVLSEYISGSSVRIYYADAETKEKFGNEHCICISNHKFEVDWMFCWMFVDKLRCLGVCILIYKKIMIFLKIFNYLQIIFVQIIFFQSIFS